jgi:hypothetical protein
MKKPTKPKAILVIWEPADNPEARALLEAVAMMLRRRVPLSTGSGFDKTRQDAIV